MPDRHLVAHSPEQGMKILYCRKSTNYVLWIDEVEHRNMGPLIHYKYLRGAETLQDTIGRDWCNGSWNDEEDWAFWMLNGINKHVELLSGSSYKSPSWEI